MLVELYADPVAFVGDFLAVDHTSVGGFLVKRSERYLFPGLPVAPGENASAARADVVGEGPLCFAGIRAFRVRKVYHHDDGKTSFDPAGERAVLRHAASCSS